MTSAPRDLNSRMVTSAFGWIALCTYSNQVLGILSTLILAKVLTPEDFGIVAIASIMLGVIQIVKDMGLSEAVIYTKRDDRIALDTAHTVLVAYNVLLFVGAVCAAPLVARFYGNPTITPVAIIMSSTLVLNSLRVIPFTVIRRNLDYRSLVIPEVVPATVSSLVSIALALLGFGVWSLVAKAVVQSALAVVLLSRASHFKPRFGFDRAAAAELIHYGKFIAGTSVLLVGLYNVDRFYVSVVVGVAALGMFELAMRIAEIPVRQVSFLVGSVMFPVFSRVERSGAALGPLFMKTLRYTSAVTLPAAIGIAVFGPSLLQALYGSRWDGIGATLQIVALYAGIRSLSSVIYDGYKATGQPRVMQRLVLFKLVVIAGLGIPVLNGFGVPGMAVLILVTYMMSLAWEIVALASTIKTRIASIVRVLILPFVISAAVMSTVHWAFSRVSSMESVSTIILAMAVAGCAYLVLYCLCDREIGSDVRALMADRRQPAPSQT